jgi:hypothetical protein
MPPNIDPALDANIDSFVAQASRGVIEVGDSQRASIEDFSIAPMGQDNVRLNGGRIPAFRNEAKYELGASPEPLPNTIGWLADNRNPRSERWRSRVGQAIKARDGPDDYAKPPSNWWNARPAFGAKWEEHD